MSFIVLFPLSVFYTLLLFVIPFWCYLITNISESIYKLVSRS